MAILRRLGIFLAQAKSYAVLTKSVLPTEALISIERWDGTVIWEWSKAVAQKEKMITWKEGPAAAASAAAASSSSTPEIAAKAMPIQKAVVDPSRWTSPTPTDEVKEEVSQPLPEKGSTAEGQEGQVGQGEEVPPTKEAPQSLPEKGSKAEGAGKVAFKWEPIVSSLGGPPRPRVSKRSVSVVDRTSFQEGGAQVPPDRFVQRPGNPIGK